MGWAVTNTRLACQHAGVIDSRCAAVNEFAPQTRGYLLLKKEACTMRGYIHGTSPTERIQKRPAATSRFYSFLNNALQNVCFKLPAWMSFRLSFILILKSIVAGLRSEERRVGKECR